MDLEYDRKFEEMKKYIPFLENMITRLESTSTTSSNPRQAQLDKIRSLRDLLSNKRKRMKMENLVKCEQVLINLYTKVEQRDTLSCNKKTTDTGFSIDTPTPKEKSDLEAVRNKLKTVVKRQESVQDTLPEILPRSDVNDVHTSGTKEPALFQRRPNHTNSEVDESRTTSQSSTSKRNYTRVLISPERHWSPTKTPAEKPLFSRRSPRKSPRRYSPSYHKRERKKPKDRAKRKDLNITLNVPEESLNSLNTKDILSRIINCSDGDVDIDTLRELRKQILGELQKTGAKDDISDLILKSYNKNKTKKNKVNLKEEVEEGELSDSESEAIESIYGSLIVKEPGPAKVSSDKNSQPRKIQICLVINSDDKVNQLPQPDTATEVELEMFETEHKDNKKKDLVKEQDKFKEAHSKTTSTEKTNNVDVEGQKMPEETVSITSKNIERPTAEPKGNAISKQNDNITVFSNEIRSNLADKIETTLKESIQFKANFYKPLVEQRNSETTDTLKDKKICAQIENDSSKTSNNVQLAEIETTLERMEKSPEIPLLHEPTIEKKPPDSTLSEIDILQALKNEILSDIPVPGTDTTTPLLHQPKVIKVASAQEILPKKRISIEKYKEKSGNSSKTNFDQVPPKDDQTKKPSLKLTDKECERFFNIPKIPFDDEDESLDDVDDDILVSDVYGDLAPKSPDHESSSLESAPPVIIPVDPVKSMPVSHKADVDMRTLPLVSPNKNRPPSAFDNVSPLSNDSSVDKSKNENTLNKATLIDPRVRRDPNVSNQSPNPHAAANSDRMPRPNMFSVASTNSSSKPLVTTNARTYEMTPTHQSFEVDQSSRQHVYVPAMTFEYREREKSVCRIDDIRETCWNPPQRDTGSQNKRFNESANTDKHNSVPKNDRYVDKREDLCQRSETPATSTQPYATQCQTPMPLQSFGRSDCPPTQGHPFGRLECPPTPSHPFGRLDCPPTPSHSFGRLECPPTPSYTFGRSDCPPTPNHPFGRTDCPPTPNHPFGRTDCPPTPNHPFGRTDCPPTPNHAFGRTDCPPTPSHPFGRTDSPSASSHPFGRIDCPPTPSHPFGRIDCPPTPSHPFGRPEGPVPLMLNLIECPPTPNNQFTSADCPSTPQTHQFGYHESPQTPGHPFVRTDPTKNSYVRSDFNNQKYIKDPRLNRKPESDSKPPHEERDRGYYKDRDRYRGSSYSSHKSYSDRSKYKYYSPELRARQYNKEQEKYDHSSDVSTSKDRHSRNNTESRSNEEVVSRRDYQADKSFQRNMRPEDSRSFTRASSVGRKSITDTEHNMLSVKSNAGRSFTINTSINTTFQKYNHSQEIENSFDARRQRAASVGRTLTREFSVGRTLLETPKPIAKLNENKKDHFRRAASVGRDVFADKRSFQEIKADFSRFSTKELSPKKSESRTVTNSLEISDHAGRSRKDNYEREKTEKRRYESSKSYSPRKNYRDPRMRKQFENKNDRNCRDAYYRKSGIVYSNDNIVSGSILSSGYGVKNYKIPKIKRPVEEKDRSVENADNGTKDEKDTNIKTEKDLEVKVNTKEQQDVKETSKEQKAKQNRAEAAVIATEQNKEASTNVGKSDEIVEKRQTRSSKKSITEPKADDGTVTKTKKYKTVIYDSESEGEVNIQENIVTKDNKSTKNDKPTNPVSPIKQKEKGTKLDPADLDSSFGIDELEMFADNIVSDPVIDDNINALIADLDDDLSTSKCDSSHNFTKEISLENMMQNISSPSKDGSTRQVEDDTDKILKAIDDIANDKVEVPLVDKDEEMIIQNKDSLNISPIPNQNKPDVDLEDSKINKDTNDKDGACLKDTICTAPTQSDAVDAKDNLSSNNLPSASVSKSNSADIDSTTEVEDSAKSAEDKSVLEELNDGCSTPDSTNNSDEALQKSTINESVTGNTNEVTSTESIEPKPSSSAKEITPALDSIGSLLSILQDKSKIKELLNMLGDQSSDNEKIKKKLEKLSEIVSDDEETCESASKSPKPDNAEKSVIKSSDITITKDFDTKQSLDLKDVAPTEDDDMSKDSSALNDTDSKLDDDDTKNSDNEADLQETDTELQDEEVKPKKKRIRKTKGIKKQKAKLKKVKSIGVKRVTRATAAETKPKIKKPPRELAQLQEDIKEMFIRDDVLSATGIRMCRLAKLVDEKIPPAKEEPVFPEVGPVVVIEKFRNMTDKNVDTEQVKKKKLGPKTKSKILSDRVPDASKGENIIPLKRKPGPKSKTKSKRDDDPYEFESDSVGDNNTEKASDAGSSSNSDSESDSFASSKSFGSTELLADIKKKTKRKRRGWQSGIIKTKTKKKKVDAKPTVSTLTSSENLPDYSCFTDRNYCFRKNQLTYACRLCSFIGADIVLHYRNQHPHVEIPLSRMTQEVANEAIDQCEEINFKAISKIPSDKYVCTFCFKEFTNNKSVLETFFWHIVSMHTGEYKQNCSKCVDVKNCPFNLDIPPPPKDIKGQLIGFICKKCNFTQISLENLKTHVIVRHNDEQTAVYTINLSVMTKKSLSALLRRSENETSLLQISRDSTEKDNESEGVKTRTSARKSNQPVTPPIQSKITFEGDDNSELSDLTSETGELNIKIEKDSENVDAVTNTEDCLAADVGEVDSTDKDQLNQQDKCAELKPSEAKTAEPEPAETGPSDPPQSEPMPSSDIVDYPHFKINVTDSGAKEYFCCINGNYHFKTTLLISMKKHVQLKHSENWDGYCYVCKVIVTPQGAHRFRDCLQHYLDKHIDNFPIFEKVLELISTPTPTISSDSPTENQQTSKSSVRLRPLSDLITKSDATVPLETATMPVIQSVMSLGTPPVEAPLLTTANQYPAVVQEVQTVEKIIKYEEHQAEVLSKKYYLVIQAMMVPETLIKIFKCAGKYCLYATDSGEEALVHATTHQRIGGMDALNCSYCNFDSAGNAVDLVTHVFKTHGYCQYCCQQCFYRAASSQAVGAHIFRVHGVAPEPGSVLRSTKVSSIPVMKHKMLTREQAVSHYVCGHNDGDGSCKFRTYTPDKFCEHLLQRHSTAAAHPCQICSTEVATAADLVQHMKDHGLKLYQCTWCVHGADNEMELLTHISTLHADKQPQAYIRIITNKDGSSELRVLPLAVLNKYKVPTQDIASTATKEHAVREAERSIEMEALIGPFMTEPTAVETEIPIQTGELAEQINEAPKDVKPLKDIEVSITPNVEQPSLLQLLNKEPVASFLTTPLSPQTTPIKTEPVEKNVGTDVVVLDSDDEDTSLPPQPVIDLSEEETSQNVQKEKAAPTIVSDTNLYTCPKCKQVCKNMGGLKKHIYSCAVNMSKIQCPHCGSPAENLEKLVWHYVADHSAKNTFECGICGELLVTENFAKKHFKNVHKEGTIVITRTNKEGAAHFIITARKKSVELVKERVAPKRKLSGPKTDVTPTKRRFEPQEIDQLPINPILDQLVYCSRCEFSTKVRLNMVRHLQLHAEQQPVPQTAPVNPVPHLESNEKHFDKMVNLASSSIVNRTPDKVRPEHAPAVTLLIPPEAASRYPKYVPERQRHTCGAKGCSYISVDEAMLRCHWETLHSGTSDFHCVHCPPHQHLDTSKPLTATRVISHLKMHDSTLYACSSCSYYHFKKEALEKHLSEVHKTGRLMVVREEQSTPVSPATSQINVAPTMDLKPWQCGLCKFKSMLRPEVVDHCSKFHQSKMQFKCAYCPFRTSTIENISKHQTNSHAGKPEEIFYYYYREGSIPDEADGTPRWVKQRQKANIPDSDMKLESLASTSKNIAPAAPSPPINIDLNLVKKEVSDVSSAIESIEDLCKRFGQFCEPNGIKFKCPLCSVVMDDTKEGMQSHLYEELNYRKWSCGLCSYKAFHKAGLTDHMTSEHRRQYDHIELPTDINIEKWVTSMLDHQATIINKYRENLAKQKIIVENNKPGPSTETPVVQEPSYSYNEKDLDTAFGYFGAPIEGMFCCPKCTFMCKEEAAIKNHLEMELNKIRWCCSNCPDNFQTYHEAQFHCKGHDGPSRPIEAIRNPAMRAAWVSTAIKKQKQSIIQNMPPPTTTNLDPSPAEENAPDTENSLLVVRYEERIPTPDQVSIRRKRPASTPTQQIPTSESEDERVVSDEYGIKKKLTERQCAYCEYTSNYTTHVRLHMLTHFNLKPFTCGYCSFSSYKKTVAKHVEDMHPNKPIKVKVTEIPKNYRKDEVVPTVTCLVCEKIIPELETDTHLHNNVRPDFARGEDVVKCCLCLALILDVTSSLNRHNKVHANEPVRYTPYKLGQDTRDHRCTYCDSKFKFVKDYRAHHLAAHPEMPVSIMSWSYPGLKKADPPKRCARKSTTKLPNSVAKKSTTKLPYSVPSRSTDVEYSYYGTKPAPLQNYNNVTTLMSFCNKMMPFTLKQLSDLLNIEPKVVVTDIKHSSE